MSYNEQYSRHSQYIKCGQCHSVIDLSKLEVAGTVPTIEIEPLGNSSSKFSSSKFITPLHVTCPYCQNIILIKGIK